MNPKTNLLKKIYFFEDLSYYELLLLASIVGKKFYKAESVIFEENSDAKELYIIMSGAVRISKITSDLDGNSMAIMRNEEYFGEMALVEDEPRSATAIAHEDSYLLLIDKEDFGKLLYLHKKIAFKVLWRFAKFLSDRVREVTEKDAGLTTF